ncbi:ROK family protein [Tomitella fengzijianii]|uniref:ROK family protein n=1 Tax=Tomitella fengzijianii TaxID=2597660 RepID=A0A516X8B0_9ACTN|nr:ROK family protein [Tomitella fengzijianii]QDQ99304.1 ROK family protein [Tomitella fengzijianii]
MDHAIGIDIGGTNLRAAVVDPTGAVVDAVSVDTPTDAGALDEALVDVIGELSGRHAVSAVGLAVAGFVSRDQQTVRFAPHLPWRDAAVPARISPRVGLPVFLEHDANSAAWGEARFGPAGAGENVAVLAIGTGIGAALLVDGRLYRGSNGVAPELGHLQVVPGGRQCACGKSGCFERYCSGTALAATAAELLAAEPGRPSELRRAPDGVTGAAVADAAAAGDPVALETMADFAYWLGMGLSIVADVFDPDLIVVAGGVATSAPLFLDDARRVYAGLVTGAGHRRLARIRRSELGVAAAMVGAAELARRNAAASGTDRIGGGGAEAP